MIQRLNKQGDTIIEVILAMAILAFVLFSSWAITNRASQVSLAARQRVVMVNRLKEQAELLKAMNTSEIKAKASDPLNPALKENPCSELEVANTNSQPQGGFWVGLADDTKNPLFKDNSIQVGDDVTQRVWIQKNTDKQVDPTYADFYVRACWVTTGGSQKLDNSQFIVRLNL